jgi:hypothetical protein
MAEYYPLLAKAVAGIPNSTPEMRRAVYERARKALLTQLTNLNPPIPEGDIARETEALDGAVERLEAEMASVNGHASASLPVGSGNAPAAKAPSRMASVPPPRRPLAPGPPLAPAALGGKSSDSKSSEALFPGPLAAGAAAYESSAMKMPEQRSGRPSDSKETGTDSGSGAETEQVFGSFEDMMAADAQRPRTEGPRLYVPQPGAADEAHTSFRLWIVGGIVALVVAIVAVAAWSLRDRASEIAKLKPSAAVKTEPSGKIVARIGGPKPAETSSDAAPAQAPSTAANPEATGRAATSTAAAPAAKPAGQTVAVTHRAALLVALPGGGNKTKTYIGTVIWRLDNVSAGPGQALGTAVHADIDVPEDKMKVSLTLQKNTDPSLEFSQTMTVVFTVQPDSPTGGIKQINAPQLRAEDTPYGVSLSGVPVPIMANSFLIGLSRGNAEKTNLDLIKQRAWFDIPILLDDGRIAKLTFEKGVSGTRVIDDAVAAWQAP